MQPQDQNLLQWITGILIAFAAGTWAVLRDIYRRIEVTGNTASQGIADARRDAFEGTSGLKKQTENDFRALWDKVDRESDIARVHRESVLTRMGDLTTKEDLNTMEKRMTAALSAAVTASSAKKDVS